MGNRNIKNQYHEVDHLEEGNRLYNEHKFLEAIEFYDKAISMNRRDPEPYNNKGLALELLGRHDEAIAMFNKAISLEKDYADPYINKGNVLQLLGKYAEAVRLYNKSIAISPTNADAFNCKGVALKRLGKYDEAIISHDKAIYIENDYAEAYYNKAIALQLLGRYDEAIISYNNVISMNKSFVSAYNNMGFVYECMKRFNDALEYYDMALKIDPSYIKALKNKYNVLKIIENTTISPRTSKINDRSKLSKYAVLNYDAALCSLDEKCFSCAFRSHLFDVFISYSWKQKDMAANLLDLLTKSGLNCWMNKGDTGEVMPDELIDSIICSRLVILCISNSYLQSFSSLREFHLIMAFKNKTTIVPVMFEDKEAFAQWPPLHQIFFMLVDTPVVTNINKYLSNKPSTFTDEINKFLFHLTSKIGA